MKSGERTALPTCRPSKKTSTEAAASALTTTTPDIEQPVKRTRKRTGGKKLVRSCTACRSAHIRCVADRYGVPCERCAKKSREDCSLMQFPSTASPESQPEHHEPHPKTSSTTEKMESSKNGSTQSRKSQVLQQMAAAVEAYMAMQDEEETSE
ncbi:hypothetical protein F5Y15DRAFT_370184 [Xylariaceae sp. FL0016]|nr:hypothetical protein F5Y15DRAFT_370184 [Xylariaceae sp. FL0016]